MRYLPLWTAALALWLAGCEGREPVPPPSPPTTVATLVEPAPAADTLNRGARLFQAHCAQCHGPEAQGHPDWDTPGVVAAPPLDGTGNEWKRSRAELVSVIVDGAMRDGEPVMPGWRDRLSDAEVDDVITWFQALWPPEVYAKWKEADASAGAGSSQRAR